LNGEPPKGKRTVIPASFHCHSRVFPVIPAKAGIYRLLPERRNHGDFNWQKPVFCWRAAHHTFVNKMFKPQGLRPTNGWVYLHYRERSPRPDGVGARDDGRGKKSLSCDDRSRASWRGARSCDVAISDQMSKPLGSPVRAGVDRRRRLSPARNWLDNRQLTPPLRGGKISRNPGKKDVETRGFWC
jgi:hypothetical protein